MWCKLKGRFTSVRAKGVVASGVGLFIALTCRPHGTDIVPHPSPLPLRGGQVILTHFLKDGPRRVCKLWEWFESFELNATNGYWRIDRERPDDVPKGEQEVSGHQGVKPVIKILAWHIFFTKRITTEVIVSNSFPRPNRSLLTSSVCKFIFTSHSETVYWLMK